MIPDVYITVAFYDDLECEVSHVLYFVTTDFQTRSNTVKALLITKLLKVPFTSQLFFFFYNESRVSVNTTMPWCCSFPSVVSQSVCSPQSELFSAAG